MSYKVIWTPRSEKNFADIVGYLEKEWDKPVMLAFFDRVDQLLKIISDNPELFPSIDKERKIHKSILNRHITLYYKIKPTQIDLLTFWDNRQDPKKLKL